MSEFQSQQSDELRITGRYLILIALAWLVVVIAILWWTLIRPMLAL